MVGIWEGAAFIGLEKFCTNRIRRSWTPAKTFCWAQSSVRLRADWSFLCCSVYSIEARLKQVSRYCVSKDFLSHLTSFKAQQKPYICSVSDSSFMFVEFDTKLIFSAMLNTFTLLPYSLSLCVSLSLSLFALITIWLHMLVSLPEYRLTTKSVTRKGSWKQPTQGRTSQFPVLNLL